MSATVRGDLEVDRREQPKVDPMRFHPRRPGRPPDWRWGWATALVDGSVPPSRRRDDAWVIAATRFLKALRRCRDEADREALESQMPDLSAAHAIYTGTLTRRWAIEARLLAGEAFEDIGAKHGASEGAVASFERVFFSVADCLTRTDYILLSAIKLHPGSSNLDLGVAWRWLGYFGGPPVVDFLLGTHSDGIKPERPEQADAFMVDHARDELLKKMAVASLTLPVGGDALKLLGIYHRLLKDERRARELVPTMEAIRPNIAAFRDALPSILKDEESSLKAEDIAVTPGSIGQGDEGPMIRPCIIPYAEPAITVARAGVRVA